MKLGEAIYKSLDVCDTAGFIYKGKNYEYCPNRRKYFHKLGNIGELSFEAHFGGKPEVLESNDFLSLQETVE